MSRLSRALSLRFLKFALVGGIGIAVQLGVMAEMRVLKVNCLGATGLAVEAAVVHNFLWPQRFTWADRAMPAGKEIRKAQVIARLLRFQLTNGAISLAGDPLLMRVLVGFAGISPWLASLLSITLCAWGNFLASDQWVFSSQGESVARPAELG
jgi:dolichol-phosphate mannosyltransferase